MNSLAACATSVMLTDRSRANQRNIGDLCGNKGRNQSHRLLISISNSAHQLNASRRLVAAPPLRIITTIDRDAVDQINNAFIATTHQIGFSLTRLPRHL
jgi:hypothetical protein